MASDAAGSASEGAEPVAAAERADGRLSRTRRSRLAICDACLDLVEEGVLQPSADQVAERSGLSRRSVFYHFSDLPALYDAVVEEGMRRCAPLLKEIPREGSARERVALLAEGRARFLEATTPFRRAMTASALVGPTRRQAVRVARDLLRAQRDEIAGLFDAELETLSPNEHAEVCEALSVAASPATWEYLRFSRGLPVARARAVMERSLIALLRDAGVEIR